MNNAITSEEVRQPLPAPPVIREPKPCAEPEKIDHEQRRPYEGSETTVVDVLRQARELLAEPGRWTQGSLARDADGHSSPLRGPAAVCWCSIGAVERITKTPGTAYKYLKAAMGCGIAAWNDAPERTQSEVVAAFDAAVALAAADDQRRAREESGRW